MNRKFLGVAFHGDISHVGQGCKFDPLALQQHAPETERQCLDALTISLYQTCVESGPGWEGHRRENNLPLFLLDKNVQSVDGNGLCASIDENFLSMHLSQSVTVKFGSRGMVGGGT